MSEQLGAGLDIEDVREVFDLFDFWDGRDGLIGAEKVGDLLRCLGLNPTKSLVKKMGGTEKPGEKQFSFEEFLPIVKSILKVDDIGTFREFSEAFKSFDREGMGFITAGEMNYMLTSMGERLTDEETDAIMHDTDTTPDIDGNLKYEDFIKKVMKGHTWKK
ncbi:myosin, essential light chain, adductor muscle-like isoform X1 [Mya arenaria]|uniref:myosin, essential light chain, adductor muscle-like isoform X1 n=1 Tax=Mya arenaria TaxID=6604 RepID=UPI0022E949A3|nr:myosin, essential light chain, adductor muscle-like isoform X1 [Mya arenaria]